MVYIEEQSTYLNQFVNSPIRRILNEILLDELGELSSDLLNAGDIALNLLISVKSNDHQQAVKYYTILSKRQPTKESHWIYDNFVLFSIICTIRKFELDSEWIKNVIDISYPGADPINKKIKDTFKNILAGNYNSKGDFHQISLVYQHLAVDEYYNNEAINKMFHHLWLKSFPFFEDNFLNIMSIKAIEISVLKKELLTDLQSYYLNNFIPSFNTRADLLAKFLSRFIISGLIFIVFFLLWKFYNSETQYPKLVKIILFLSSFSGVGVLAIWGWKNNLAKFFRKLINKLFKFNSY